MQPPFRSFSSHIGKSILVTLFCCQGLGIIAIIYSILAMISDGKGDYEKADSRAKTADSLCNVSLVIGLIIVLFTMFAEGCTGLSGL